MIFYVLSKHILDVTALSIADGYVLRDVLELFYILKSFLSKNTFQWKQKYVIPNISIIQYNFMVKPAVLLSIWEIHFWLVNVISVIR